MERVRAAYAELVRRLLVVVVMALAAIGDAGRRRVWCGGREWKEKEAWRRGNAMEIEWNRLQRLMMSF